MIPLFPFIVTLGWAILTAAGPVRHLPRTVTALDQAGTAEAQQRDDTATRAFSDVQIMTADGQCLFVDKLSGDARENLTPVQVGACGSTDGQGWDIITAGKHIDVNDSMIVVSTLTQACLNFDPRRPAGNQVILFSCGGRADGSGDVTNSQLFPFNGTGGPLSFEPENNSSTCLVVNGTLLGAAECDSTDTNQSFTFGNAVSSSGSTTLASVSATTTTTSKSASSSTVTAAASSTEAGVAQAAAAQTSSSSVSDECGSDGSATASQATVAAATTISAAFRSKSLTVSIPFLSSETPCDEDVTVTVVVTETATAVATAQAVVEATTTLGAGIVQGVAVVDSSTSLSSLTSTSASPSTVTSSTIASTASVSRGGVLNPSAAAEANPRDDTATRAFTGVEIRAPDGNCLFVDPTAGDFRENLIPISLVNCSGSDNEKWDVITAGKHNDQPGNALIVSSLTNGCISLDPRRATNDTVTVFSCGGRADGGGDTNADQLIPFIGALSFAFAPMGENNQTCILPGDGKLISGDCPTDGSQLFSIFS